MARRDAVRARTIGSSSASEWRPARRVPDLRRDVRPDPDTGHPLAPDDRELLRDLAGGVDRPEPGSRPTSDERHRLAVADHFRAPHEGVGCRGHRDKAVRSRRLEHERERVAPVAHDDLRRTGGSSWRTAPARPGRRLCCPRPHGSGRGRRRRPPAGGRSRRAGRRRRSRSRRTSSAPPPACRRTRGGRPAPRKAMRSQTRMFAVACVTTTTVRPSSARSRKVSISRRSRPGSRPEVGSSRNSTGGPRAARHAMLTRLTLTAAQLIDAGRRALADVDQRQHLAIRASRSAVEMSRGRRSPAT